MIRRYTLIIDMRRKSIEAGVFSTGNMKRLASFSSPVENDMKGALFSIIHQIEEAGYKRFSRILLGLPADKIELRVINLPFSDRKKIAEVLPYEVEGLFLESTEKIFRGLPLGEGMVLAVATAKDTLKEFLNILKDSGMNPNWIGSAFLCKDRLLSHIYNGDEAAAFVDSDSIVVLKNRKPCFYKGLRDEMDMKLSLTKLENEGVDVTWIYSTPEMADGLNIGEKDVIPVDMYPDSETGLTALALQVGEGLRETVNFKGAELDEQNKRGAYQGDIRKAAFLMSLLLILWGIHMYMSYRILNNEAIAAKNALSKAYNELFPGEGKLVDALYQLEIKFKQLREKRPVLSAGVDILDIMRELARANSGGGVHLYRLNINGKRITAAGETTSFDEASRFKGEVAKILPVKDIILSDVKATSGGRVGFIISITLGDLKG